MKEDYWQPIIKNMYATLNRASIRMEYFVFDDDHIDLETIKNLSYVVIGLLLVTICGLIVLFFEMN